MHHVEVGQRRLGKSRDREGSKLGCSCPGEAYPALRRANALGPGGVGRGVVLGEGGVVAGLSEGVRQA